jgi:protein-L-isoaspartate(D-aspartate) O-methyltransferase
MDEYWTTPSAEPTSVYHDVLIALDAERNINNGQPSLWAFSFSHLASAKDEHVLHLGCGTGYYTAILATLIGAGGRITAIELDPVLCARAREALAPWPNVTVQQSDGSDALSEPADIIVASAGATHPRLTWLSALKRGGRLLFPMTGTRGWGGMLLVNKFGSGHFSARFLCRVAFIGFSGMRDPEFARRIDNLFMQERGAGVKSLRLDDHPLDESCWFHNADWCLSSNDAAQELAS